MPGDPTPEMIAAAEQIDVTRYEGHTPWPWIADEFISLSHAKEEGYFGWAREGAFLGPVACVWQAVNGGTTGLPGSVEVSLPNGVLIADAPLIPALVHLLKQARAERDAAREEVLRAAATIEELVGRGIKVKDERDAERQRREWAVEAAELRDRVIDKLTAAWSETAQFGGGVRALPDARAFAIKADDLLARAKGESNG